ncbi:MAG: SURF1 family protein [Gammaproteobacteria bacterium]|nr:SURF1 family protein [Gammaproteobacteria bacterium]
MAIGLGNRRFKPGMWPTLVTLALVALTCSLGNWQLDRAEEKAALYASFEAGDSDQGALPINQLEADSRPFTPVTAYGRLDSRHQLLLDAMMHGGRTGYQVLTPLLRDGEPAVLINRGWIEAESDRGSLPRLEVGEMERRVTGLAGHLPEPAMRLGRADPAASDWPRVTLYPTREQVEEMLGYSVLDTLVYLDADEPDGFLRDWRPQLLSPEKHLGYAMQWFAMALALVVIYVVVNLRRPEEGKHD